MKSFMIPLGIFGGTFNPIHNGHILPILEACRKTGIQEVHYIPNARPGHRATPGTGDQHRLNMISLAIEGLPGFVANDCEIARAGTSYTVPTLRMLRQTYRNRPLCLILGMDAFAQMWRWYWRADVLRLAHIIVVNRFAAPPPRRMPLPQAAAACDSPHVLFRRICGAVVRVSARPVDVSSSELRQKFARGEDVTGLVPAKVAEYVKKHDLYRTSSEAGS